MSEDCPDCPDVLEEDAELVKQICDWRGCTLEARAPVIEVSVIPPGYRRKVDVEVALCAFHQLEMRPGNILKIDWSIVHRAEAGQVL